MAKYTELFSEYLENGGTLPTIFSQIDGFAEQFTQYYCDKEIGFETETLFALKLELMAGIYIPLYKERIDDRVSAYTKIKAPTKVYYETNSLTMTIGEQDSNMKNVPFNANNANPSVINHADESVNENAGEVTREDSGFTPDEALRMYTYINEEVHSLVIELLREFRHLFMGVF